jgi:hypothetical protein
MISVTEILGTDSLSGSRLVINDNFSILASEINSIETYFNPTAGTITNLNDVRTESLRVGLSTVLLDINAATFDILTNVRVSNGDITLSGGGLVRNDIDPNVLNDTFAGPLPATYDIGTSTAVPPYTTERVGNFDTVNTLTLQLNEGAIGQELFFIYTDATTGDIDITGVGGILILPPTNTIVRLNDQGQTAHFMCIDDGTGNGQWYLVGGTNYTLA